MFASKTYSLVEYYQMKKEEIKDILQQFQKELFAFGFALLPDELQVQQMVIDVINLIQVEGDNKAELVRVMKGDIWDADKKFVLRTQLLKNLYSMAKRRYSQIRESLESRGIEEFSSFYALHFEERALLWLQAKSDLEQEDIRQILGCEKSKLLSSLSNSREKLTHFYTGAN